MNGVKPIPAELLTDSAVLLTPTGSGYLRDNLDSVRIVRVSAITDYTTGRTRDCTELVMYFDCVNSSPSGTEFAAGQSLEYCGETYEVVSAELFAGEDPHHWRVKARKTGGERITRDRQTHRSVPAAECGCRLPDTCVVGRRLSGLRHCGAGESDKEKEVNSCFTI